MMAYRHATTLHIESGTLHHTECSRSRPPVCRSLTCVYRVVENSVMCAPRYSKHLTKSGKAMHTCPEQLIYAYICTVYWEAALTGCCASPCCRSNEPGISNRRAPTTRDATTAREHTQITVCRIKHMSVTDGSVQGHVSRIADRGVHLAVLNECGWPPVPSSCAPSFLIPEHYYCQKQSL